MKLFFSSTSPYVRKVMICAHELGLSSQIELLPAKASPVERDKSLVDKNPLGKVPTLITHEGISLYDSRVICEYLNDIGSGHLFPQDKSQKWEALTMQSLGDGLLDAALLARYETFLRPKELCWNEWVNGQRDKIQSSLTYFESLTLADKFHIGQITLACSLGYLDLRFEHLNWRQSNPKLKAWFEVISQRESVAKQWALAS
jgi:glutathione S-transferase